MGQDAACNGGGQTGNHATLQQIFFKIAGSRKSHVFLFNQSQKDTRRFVSPFYPGDTLCHGLLRVYRLVHGALPAMA
jgi:predicted RNA binding protein YcfA (HicA-like mRNA interferase family)